MMNNLKSHFNLRLFSVRKIATLFLLFVFTCPAISSYAAGGVLEGSDVLDQVYIPEHIITRKVIPYTHLREADVMWMKRIWRVIDLRQKFNMPFYYPTSAINNRKALIDVIKDGVFEGTITAYAEPLLDDEFKYPMTKDDVEAMFKSIDTVTVEDPVTGEFIEKIQEAELEADKIKQYWIKEDWFFDKQRSVMEARIIGIAPLQESIDEMTGNIRGYSPMFWIYYPQARYVFANAPVFNRFNDAERRTYEDIFWKRMFQSYIRKESNVYDRTILEYTKGINTQLEAERIKDEMYNFEHDLWHF
ncbi:MAG: gliding motility protein GldN [Bacteroidota bacterium]